LPSKECIIICAGDGTRWNNHQGVPKHLLKIEGEILVERLVKQLRVYEETKIKVVVKEKDKRYKIKGSKLFVADLNKENVDADKFLSSEKLWNKKGRTIVFYGDVWFSDEAIKRIMGHDDEDWILFGRHHASKITGCPWGECFAQSFLPHSISEHKQNLHKIASEYKNGNLKRCGGWEHYRAMAGLELNDHIIGERFFNIDDYTDDFDLPEDLSRWNRKRLSQFGPRNELVSAILNEVDDDSKELIYLSSTRPVSIINISKEIGNVIASNSRNFISQIMDNIGNEKLLINDARNFLLGLLRINNKGLKDFQIREFNKWYIPLNLKEDERVIRTTLFLLEGEDSEGNKFLTSFHIKIGNSIKSYSKDIEWSQIINYLDHKKLAPKFVMNRGIYVPKILAFEDDFSQVKLDNLPNEFVLKPLGGNSNLGVFILKKVDGVFLDLIRNIRFSEDELAEEYAKHVNNPSVNSKILINEKINDNNDKYVIPRDYKFYCFYGKLMIIMQKDANNNNPEKEVKYKYWNENWEDLGEIMPIFSYDRRMEKPNSSRKLIEIVENLSSMIPLPFVRIDMFDSENGPAFGEFTFHPGTYKNYTLEWDQKLGQAYEDAEQRIKESGVSLADFIKEMRK
jgi:hypothetical protein